MEFIYKGNRIILRGTQKVAVEWVGGKRLQKTMLHSAQLFGLQMQPTTPVMTKGQPTVKEP